MKKIFFIIIAAGFFSSAYAKDVEMPKHTSSVNIKAGDQQMQVDSTCDKNGNCVASGYDPETGKAESQPFKVISAIKEKDGSTNIKGVMKVEGSEVEVAATCNPNNKKCKVMMHDPATGEKAEQEMDIKDFNISRDGHVDANVEAR